MRQSVGSVRFFVVDRGNRSRDGPRLAFWAAVRALVKGAERLERFEDPNDVGVAGGQR